MPHRASSPSPDHHGKAVRRRYGAWRLCSVSRWPSLESGQALNDVRSTPAVDTPRGTLPGECRRTNRHREALITHRRYFFRGIFHVRSRTRTIQETAAFPAAIAEPAGRADPASGADAEIVSSKPPQAPQCSPPAGFPKRRIPATAPAGVLLITRSPPWGQRDRTFRRVIDG